MSHIANAMDDALASPSEASTRLLGAQGCFAGKWVLAVGSSPLRILYSALVERLMGPEVQAPPACMPTWRFLHAGPCMTHGASRFPHQCIVDVIDQRAQWRLTFVWSFGLLNNATAHALDLLLRTAAGRTPDILIVEAGAWSWGRNVQRRSAQSAEFLDSLLARLPAITVGSSLARQQLHRSLCIWVGTPWGRYEDGVIDAGGSVAGRPRSTLAVPAYNEAMRPRVVERRCLMLDAYRVCERLAANRSLHDARCPTLAGQLPTSGNGHRRRCCASSMCTGKCFSAEERWGPFACYFPRPCEAYHAFGEAAQHVLGALASAVCTDNEAKGRGAGSLHGIGQRSSLADTTEYTTEELAPLRAAHAALHGGLVSAGWHPGKLCFWHVAEQGSMGERQE